jgi:predicted DNA-binding protein (UPF0251 family)
MPRKKCKRFIEREPDVDYYKPIGIPLRNLDEVVLQLDEFEAIRLADQEGIYQEDAAKKMRISRQTFGRIINEAHKKIADALINGKAIKINKQQTNINEDATFESQGSG